MGHCTFIIKQEVKYAASKMNLHTTPSVIKADKPLSFFKNMVISKENMNHLFDFTVHKDMQSDNKDGGEPAAKRMRVQLSGEVSKNELLCTTLREILNVPELVVGSGILDDTPPLSEDPRWTCIFTTRITISSRV